MNRRFQETSEDVEVRAEDQARINEFGVIHQQWTDLEAQKEQLKAELDCIEDAEQEVMLASDNDVHMVRLGSAFVKVSEDEFNQFLEKKRTEAEDRRNKIAADISELETHREELKTTLYARFGTTINLET